MRSKFLHRLITMWALAAVVIGWYYVTDPDGGHETIQRLQWLAWIFVVSGPVYLVRKAFFPESTSSTAFRKSLESPGGAGLAFLGLCLLTGMLFMAFSNQARADVPANAKLYLPVLKAEQKAVFPEIPVASSLAAQIEQETCISLKSKGCWNPRTELKTDREYGFGLGQITITKKFNNFDEAKKLDSSLRTWDFADRYDPAKQIRVLVLMDRTPFRALHAVPDPRERLAMSFSAYNGGLGGVNQDRRLCASIVGCDPNKWFGNVEAHSLKSKVKPAGYGQSFYDINRGYVQNVMSVRRGKYAPYFGEA